MNRDPEGFRFLRRSEKTPRGADFAVTITDDLMAPAIPEGSVIYVSRAGSFDIGDVGIFSVNGKMVCRQYVEDSEGNLYLFTLNRKRRDQDITVTAASGTDVFLFGKVLLEEKFPLPTI